MMGIHFPKQLPIFIPQSDYSSILSNKETSSSFLFTQFETKDLKSQFSILWNPLSHTLYEPNHPGIQYRDEYSFVYEYENTRSIIQSPVQVLNMESPIYAMDTNADDSLMVIGGRKLAVYDPKLQIWRRKLEGHVSDITSCQFFPSQQVILSASLDMTLKIWGLDGSNPMTLKGHSGGVLDAAIVSRGRNVMSCSRDGFMKLWEVSSGQVIHSFNPNMGPMYSISLNSFVSSISYTDPSSMVSRDAPRDGRDPREVDTIDKRVYIGCHQGLYGIDLGSLEKTCQILCKSPIVSTDFDGKYMVYASQDGIVSVCDVANSSTPLFEFQRSNASIENVKLCKIKDKDCVLVTSSDGSCALIDLIHQQVLFELTGCDRDNLKASSVLSLQNSNSLVVKVGGRLGMLNCFLLQM